MAQPIEARRWLISGQVQGVGFRPFVYRQAHAFGLKGWVRNQAGQVVVHGEGAPAVLDGFAQALIPAAPPLAKPRIEGVEASPVAAYHEFSILASETGETAHSHVPPDYFTCDDCLAELGDPKARRYRYPFINCTQCGPRYTIIRRLPYDRPYTSLADFPLCPSCQAEYTDPLDRRFHAQPLACPECGPQLTFIDEHNTLNGNELALRQTLAALRQGKILAVKGIGGYHLICDARNELSVARLRARKQRPAKPLAVLFPWQGRDGLAAVRAEAQPDSVQAAALTDPERPIVLVPLRPEASLAPSIAPGLAEVGAILPYSPLHELLSQDFGGPLVATSANLSGEPVLTHADDVAARLAPVTDAALHHNRPILHPADDTVRRVIAGRARPIRLGRGSAPLELRLPGRLARPLLAVGGHMKNTVALAWDDRAVISPHIGDLDSPRSLAVFDEAVSHLCELYQVRPAGIVHDAHPQYASTRRARIWAEQWGIDRQAVWHHHAHAAALAGEYPEQTDPWLVFTWDGTGLGSDGSIWGGETLLGRPGQWQRVASLRPFHLPGGDKAGREPWRAAAALTWALGMDWQPPGIAAVELARQAWQRGLNSPQSSAAGRLFDVAAALLGLCQQASFEGQGPMWLETLAGAIQTAGKSLPIDRQGDCLSLDWAPLIALLTAETLPASERAAGFHDCLAASMVALAEELKAQHGPVAVGLTGGVFQNRRLCETARIRLQAAGFAVYLHSQVPSNDGGLCFGQCVEGWGRQLLARG